MGESVPGVESELFSSRLSKGVCHCKMQCLKKFAFAESF